jgi:hypothetical protein
MCVGNIAEEEAKAAKLDEETSTDDQSSEGEQKSWLRGDSVR